MNWTAHHEPVAGGRGVRYRVEADALPVSYGEVVGRWRTDATFRAWFLEVLRNSSFAAFRWETPAVTAATVDRPFEFVLLSSPGLARAADASAFAKHLRGAVADEVVTFANLGGDATLVVPCPGQPVEAYAHLAAFVRAAPEPQQHRLWQRVGEAMEKRLGPQPVWLSTAGAGVPWLHVRLDDRPKYYGYAPYRSAT